MFRISIHTINITTVADAGSVNIGNTVNAVQKRQVIEETLPGPQPEKPAGPPSPEPTVPDLPGGAPPSPPGVGRSLSPQNPHNVFLTRLPHPPVLPRPISGYRHPVVVIPPGL